MHYPAIDPIVVELGPFALRWYGLMYLLAFAAFYLLGKTRAGDRGFTSADVSDLVFYGVAGVVLGGRIGFALFYGFDRLVQDPLWLFRIWEGGMSFHGGLLGAIGAMWLQARVKGRSFLEVADFVAPLVPLGLGFGRLGNFINTELPGRVTESALGIHFPCTAVRELTATCFGEYETVARHVSSLYQACAEGLVLFVIVWLYSRRVRPTGSVAGIFLIAGGCLRFATEFFREPDAHLGLLIFDTLSMGQILSLPVVAFGIFLMNPRWANR